jgi:alpha-tubulin suppressor-like RCC1 family protein
LGTSTKNITLAAYFGSGGKMGQSVCWWDANSYFKCWGYNGAGGLGDGTNTSRTTAEITTPVITQGANAVVEYATSSLGTTCLVTSGGAVYCSGYNGDYELGIGTTSNSSSFGVATGLTSGFASVTSVPEGFCALNTSGNLYCWGTPLASQALFNSSSSAAVTTPTLSNIIGNVSSISGGQESMCSLSSTYTISCWGEILSSSNAAYGTWGGSATAITGASSPIYLTSSGGAYCVINLAGTVSCMGDYEDGQFGNGTDTLTVTFVSGMTGVTTASQVACSGLNGTNSGSGIAGVGSCCVLLNNGTVQCAGWNGYGALGQGNTTTNSSNYSPNVVSGLSNVVALQSFGDSPGSGSPANAGGFCAITQSGSVTCWGAMYSGFNTPTLTSIANIP